MIPRIALIIPCLNEAKALPRLFEQIRAHLPSSEVHIFDNGSTYNTSEIARSYGAHVHTVMERGKGRVVARMFADVDADVYVMVDGDGTYDLGSTSQHIKKMLD